MHTIAIPLVIVLTVLVFWAAIKLEKPVNDWRVRSLYWKRLKNKQKYHVPFVRACGDYERIYGKNQLDNLLLTEIRR